MRVNFFTTEKQFIRLVWFWPSPDLMTKREVFKIALNSILMMIALTGEVIFAFANFYTDLPIALNALGPVASKFSVLLKVLVLYYFRVEVMECLCIFRSKMNSEMKGDHVKTFERPVKIANIATILLAGNIALTCTYYSVLPLIQIAVAMSQGTPHEKQTPFKMLFPPPFDKNPTYEMKYVLSMYACFISLLGYVGVDGLFIGFCMHLSSHFKIIARRVAALKELFAEDPLTCTPLENERVQAEIIDIVKSHVELLDLNKRVSKIFSLIVFIHFFAAAIVIGMTSINFLLANWVSKLLYINYMAGSFIHAYLYAASGDYLHDSTLEIVSNAYHFEWYKCDVNIQKSLLMMIHRTQNSTGIEVPFFETNLSTFMSIVKTAGSYITLMNALL